VLFSAENLPKSTTLDDLELPLRTLFQNACAFGAQHENLNKDYQRRRYSPKTLASGNIRFIRILAGVYSTMLSTDPGDNDHFADFADE